MHTTFDVTVQGKLIYRTGSTGGGTQQEAHQRALEVALDYASKHNQEVPVVKLVTHE
jgi:hypothetical protein